MKFMVEYPLGTDARAGPGPSRRASSLSPRRSRRPEWMPSPSPTIPAPSKKWLERGGHATIDPFVGLGFCAAVTTTPPADDRPDRRALPQSTPHDQVDDRRRRRSPAAGRPSCSGPATCDRSSWPSAWTSTSETPSSTRPSRWPRACGRPTTSTSRASISPRSARRCRRPGAAPHPPLWLGGNAKIVRDRVASWGDGWAPMLGGGVLHQTTRTAAITTDDDFAEALNDLAERLANYGRSLSDIDMSGRSRQLGLGRGYFRSTWTASAELASLGVTWTHAPIVRATSRPPWSHRPVRRRGPQQALTPGPPGGPRDSETASRPGC